MKIFTLCMSDGHGGLELYALSCIAFYQTQPIDHVTVARANTFFAEQLATDKHISFLEKTRFKPLPLCNAKRLSRLLEQEKPDILHIHWGKDLPLAALAKKMSRHKPKLVYTRQMSLPHDKHNVYHRWIYKEVDLFLSITNVLKQQATKNLPLAADKIQTLYYGIDGKAKAPITRAQFFAEHKLDATCFTLVILGRIEHAKGQYLAIEAVEKLQQQHINIQLVIIGRAMQAEYLQSLKQQVADKQLSNQITFVDFVQEPQKILPCFDALALTTHSETFGLTLIEAMHAGVAVIGSNAGGVVEIIDDKETGLLFESGNSASLAEKLKIYIEQPEQRQQCAQAGQAKAQRLFAKEEHFKKLQEFYAALLK